MKFPFLTLPKRKNAILKSADIDPFTHWRRIILFFFAILCVSVTVSIVLVYLMDSELLVDDASRERVESLAPQALRESDLRELVGIFKTRSETRQSIIEDKNFMSDPAVYSQTAE